MFSFFITFMVAWLLRRVEKVLFKNKATGSPSEG
jgi:hypothetical protein